LNIRDLFSGIGGLALELQRAGMRPVACCEADPFARAGGAVRLRCASAARTGCSPGFAS